MKRSVIMAIGIIVLLTNVVLAQPPNILSNETTSARARVSFLMSSVENIPHNLYIVGINERRLDDRWPWRQFDKHEEIWTGKYYAYVNRPGDSKSVLQTVPLFNSKTYQTTNPSQRINVHYPNYDGFYLVKGKAGQPDILVCTIRQTGGGSFSARTFIIKNGKLQLMRFMGEEQKIRDSHIIGFERLYYLPDGTLAVPWWTNSPEMHGRYTTVYMIDVDNLILISAYTNKDN